MKGTRHITLGLVTAGLAIGSVATPVAAADPQIAFVNGIPGQRVEVCVGNAERVSSLRYTRSAVRAVDSGPRVVRFRVASAGNCDGAVLAQRTIDFAEDGDYTVVGTRQAPRVVVFDNLATTEDPIGPDAWRAIRHAADVGGVAITEEEIDYEEPEPADTPVPFVKGSQEIETGVGIEGAALIAAAKPNDARPFEGPIQVNFRDGRRTEVILVGTNKRNARFAVLDRPTLPL